VIIKNRMIDSPQLGLRTFTNKCPNVYGIAEAAGAGLRRIGWRGKKMTGLRMLLDPGKTGSEAKKLEDELRKRVVGQDHAVRQIIDVYQTYLAGMSSPGRPVGNLLFLGPTGSGKTRTVEALAEALVGDPRAVLKIDCAEFQHSHEIAKLIGSPPGYLGHRETKALLCQETLDQYHTEKVKLSFVLFDEIEKASDALWNLLLGVLDKGTLTLGDNRRVDFSNAMIFMTSNLGAAEMSDILQPKLGFAANAIKMDETQISGKISRAGTEAARRRFTPEFMNRIDKIAVFHPLNETDLRHIFDLELTQVEERLHHAAGGSAVSLEVTDEAKDYVLREGADTRYGARHLKRAIERLVVHPVSNLIATGQLEGNDRLCVEFDGDAGRLMFLKECGADKPIADSGLAVAA
jgi:ATP-dependent Clp protease ATP-binding subunit ClpB